MADKIDPAKNDQGAHVLDSWILVAREKLVQLEKAAKEHQQAVIAKVSLTGSMQHLLSARAALEHCARGIQSAAALNAAMPPELQKGG
jgi:hypothetical protein